jgi:tetratricopeptide (TPR) repeat protein
MPPVHTGIAATFLLLVLAASSSIAADATPPASTPEPPFQLTNDALYDTALKRVLADKPGAHAYPEQDFDWLSDVATAADGDRHYDLAAASTRKITVRWPYLAAPWANLACYLGKQGQFTEALECVARAQALTGADPQQLLGIKAAWLWSLGRHDEALAALPRRPDADGPETTMWLVCQAFFHAACDHDDNAARVAIVELLARPQVSHWRHFLSRDVAFDRLRQTAWFLQAVGDTAAGATDAPPFVPPVPVAGAADLLAMPDHPEETRARAAYDEASRRLGAGDWQGAVTAATDGLKSAPMLEGYVTLALGEAGLDHHVAAMDAMRAANHQGMSLDRWPNDVYGLLKTTRAVMVELKPGLEAGAAPEARERLALAVIIRAHFALDWRDEAAVLKWMDAADRLAPGLVEIPNLRAIAHMDQDDLATADNDLQRACALDPAFSDAWFNLACLRSEQGRFDEVMPLFEKSRSLCSDNSRASLRGCVFLAESGRFDEALARFAPIAAQTPPPRDTAAIAWALADEADALRRYADGERLTRQALALEPTWAMAWGKISGDLLRQGRTDEALAAVQRYVEDDEDSFDAQLCLANVLAHADRRAEAAAIVAAVAEPAGSQRFQYHALRALYAAAIADEDLLKRELAITLQAPHRLRQVRWISGDCLFDAYANQPWFKDLLATPPPAAQSATGADADPGRY